jgi:hypothetical protein
MTASMGPLVSLLSWLFASTDLATAVPTPGAWNVSGAVATATPVILPGVSVGAMTDVRRRLGHGPLFLSLRGSWTAASAANETWIIDHNQFELAAGIGVQRSMGAGRIWAAAGGGALVLHEVLSRHQLQRIQMAGVPGGTDSSTSWGPTAYTEVGVSLRLRGPVSGFIGGGPEVSRADLVDGPVWRFGAAARIGVNFDF